MLAVEPTVAALNKGASVKIALRSDAIPLPLSVELWRRVIFDQRISSDELPLELIADRGAMFLYHGLMGLDHETRLALATQPDLVRRLYDDSPESFAVFGRSLRVRDGRI